MRNVILCDVIYNWRKHHEQEFKIYSNDDWD